MRYCAITGAADGIGRALALRFASAGYGIIGIDRDPELSERTRAELVRGGAIAAFLHADLAQSAEVAALLERLAAGPLIDVFVHNAGISAVGPFASASLAQQQAVLGVNLQAPLLLTAGLLRQQQIAPGGTLVYLSSLSRFVSYPGAASYAASKDGLAAYARSLAIALAPRGIHVLTVYPGPTRTAHARRYSPDNRREHRRMPPERLADLTYHAVLARQRTLIPGAGNRLFAALGTYAPWLTAYAMRKTLFEKLPASPLQEDAPT